jgi:hypothetical protein
MSIGFRILPISCLVLSGCVGLQPDAGYDWYGELPDECFAIPLAEPCREYFDRTLPFSEETFAGYPDLRARVIEAFHVLAAHPIEPPPEGRIFGVAPRSVPLAHLCTLFPSLHADDCRLTGPERHWTHRQAIYNFVRGRVDRIDHRPDKPFTAHFTIDLVTNEQVLSVTSYLEIEPLLAAGTLVHEAKHGEVNLHVTCPSGPFKDSFACDAELAGMYGLQAVYLLALVRGGADLLTDDQVAALGSDACASISYHVLNYPDELRTLLKSRFCWLSARWVREQLGLVPIAR